MNAIHSGAARHFIYWVKAIFTPLFALFLVACAPDKPQFKSIDLTGANYAKDFALPDQNGKTRSIKDFAGKVVVVFFGFTQCPDVCPTSMADLAGIKKSLGADGDKLQGVAVAGDDKVFHWAEAKIDGDTVVLSSAEVAKPTAVRYGWGNNRTWANFFNQDGLPAVTFRTDAW